MEYLQSLWSWITSGESLGQIIAFLTASLPIITTFVSLITKWKTFYRNGVSELSDALLQAREEVTQISNQFVTYKDKAEKEYKQLTKYIKKSLTAQSIAFSNSNLGTNAKSQIVSLLTTDDEVENVAETVKETNKKIKEDEQSAVSNSDLSALDKVSHNAKKAEKAEKKNDIDMG